MDEIEIYFSYSHKDENLLRELENQLSPLERQGLIKVWHDRNIGAGVEWAKEIHIHMNTAQIILLLVSPSFMASDYCQEIEVKRAMQRHEAGEARVIPIILRPVNWYDTPFSKLQVLPAGGKPVMKWSNRDEAFSTIVQDIRKAVEEQRAKSGKSIFAPLALNPGNSSPQKETHVPQQPAVQGNKEFDVFLCHNSKDKPEVKRIAEQLKARGIVPWLDAWELRPGLPWQRALEEQIGQIKAAAVFVGQNGRGPWQDMELEVFLREFVDRKCPVIPVVLSDAPDKPQLPPFLRGMTWVDFRKQDPDPMEQLVWGITGTNPSAGGSSGQNVGGQAPVFKPPSAPASSPSFQQRSELVDKLLACPTMSNRDSRDAVLRQLNSQISSTIPRHPVDRVDMINIVNACLNFSGGIQELVSIVDYFEGDSLPMRQLKAFLGGISL